MLKPTNCILVDIDGTVANLDHRLSFVTDTTPKDWDTFFRLAVDDIPYENVIDTVLALKTCYVADLVFVTGRPESIRDATEQWIENIFDLSTAGFKLFMRETNDHRPDVVVKRDILDKVKGAGFYPVIAFDDRCDICQLWVDNGITTYKHYNSHSNQYHASKLGALRHLTPM